MLNAPGRLESAELVVRLLISENETEVESLANEANELNKLRKEETRILIDKVIIEENKVNVVYIPEANEGLIGIVSGDITEKKLAFLRLFLQSLRVV